MPARLSLRIKERYMAKRASGLSQQIAADAVGISVRSAQRIERGERQVQGQQQQRGRHWRTRADPLVDVWASVLLPMLEKAPQLEPQTLLLHLEQTFPGQEWFRRKRTLQRRVEQWKALHGPAREVMFLQHHQPGVLGISDFTVLKGEPITIAGVAFEHCQATSKTEPALCIINCYLQLVSRQDCSFPLSPTPFRLIAATPAAALLGLYAIL